MKYPILLLWLLLALTGTSQTFLVSNAAEFNQALSNVSPGGKITLRDGVWENVSLEFIADGVEGDSITLEAETPGGVVFTGTSTLEISGDYLIVKDLDFNSGQTSGSAVVSFRRNSNDVANHSRLTNCRIINYNPPTDATEYKWVSLYGTNNRVDHCSFQGKNHEGTLLVVWLSGDPNFHRIDHNYFADIPALGRNGAETIRIGTSTFSMTESRTLVEHNLFESCDGEIEIISNKSRFNVYRYNTFRDNEGTLTLRHGNDCDVYGNFFFGGTKRSGGVRIIGERHNVYNNYFENLQGDGFRAALSITNGVPDSPLNRYFQVKNATVVHNTFIGCKEPFNFGAGKSDELSLPPINSVVANNVVAQTTGSQAVTYTDTPVDFTYTSNYVAGAVGDAESGFINEDPMLEEAADFWRPVSSSPLIDNASGSYEFLTDDIEGHDRPNSPDIGSDEVDSSQPLRAPLTAVQVGYDWTEEEEEGEEEEETILSVNVEEGIELISFGRRVTVVGASSEDLPVTLQLFSLTGQKVFEETTVKETFELSSGMQGYFIGILTNRTGEILKREKLQLGQQ